MDHNNKIREVLESVKKLTNSVGTLTESVNDIHETVEFIKDNAVSKKEFNELKTEVGSIKTEVGSIKTEVGSIRAGMVTKSYLDEKLGKLQGDMVALTRKEDEKVNTLTDELDHHKVLSQDSIKKVRSVRVFPSPPTMASSRI